jgi:hypothetical protein
LLQPVNVTVEYPEDMQVSVAAVVTKCGSFSSSDIPAVQQSITLGPKQIDEGALAQVKK